MYLIKEAHIVNEGSIQVADLLIKDQRIEKIAPSISNTGNASLNSPSSILRVASVFLFIKIFSTIAMLSSVRFVSSRRAAGSPPVSTSFGVLV